MEKAKKRETAQVTAVIDRDLKKELFKILIDEGITFREWLIREIEGYVKKKGGRR